MDGSWVCLESSGDKYEVYGYQGNFYGYKVIDIGMCDASYGIPNGVTIILIFHNGLGRSNQIQDYPIHPFFLSDYGSIINDESLQNHPYDGYYDQHYIYFSWTGPIIRP